MPREGDEAPGCLIATRPPLPSGRQVIYRPPRSGRRGYKPADVGRIARYALCEYPPQEIACEMMKALGVDGDAEALLAKIDTFLRYVEPQENADAYVLAFRAFYTTVVKKLGNVTSKITKAPRFLRWILKRLFIVDLVLETINLIADLAEIQEVAVRLALEAKEFVEACGCGEETKDDAAGST